jgi:hypothetical protein
MKLNEVMQPDENATLKQGLNYLATHEGYFSTSRDVLSMMSGWFNRADPEVARLIEKLLAMTKEADLKRSGL